LHATESDVPTGRQLQAKAEAETQFIDTPSLKKLIDESTELVLVDIRTPGEIQKHGGTIDVPQNVNIVRGWLEFSIQNKVLDTDSPIVVYCGAGLRSPFAAKTLQDMGYTNVWNYAEGFFGWRDAQ
ncbi:MAG: sulfurtransferase, partial [Gammaproteobacteria bacterium]|nr:sulfurtransferase [Gammaproteobacteria bacterium]